MIRCTSPTVLQISDITLSRAKWIIDLGASISLSQPILGGEGEPGIDVEKSAGAKVRALGCIPSNMSWNCSLERLESVEPPKLDPKVRDGGY